MFETVTVEQALLRGRRMITYPVYGVFLMTIGLMFLLEELKLTPFYVGLILLLVLPWLYWSIMITRWKLWAFENVRNVHELRKRSLKEIFTPSTGGFFEKTAINTPSDKAKWMQLQDKFRQEDVFMDDLTVPEESVIYYARAKNFLQMGIMFILFAAGALLIVLGSYIYGIVAAALGGYMTYSMFKDATNKTPQIVMDSKGMRTISTLHYSWASISDEEVIKEYVGKQTHYYLIYTHPDGAEKLLIDSYDTNMIDLESLIRLHKGRFEQRNKRRNMDSYSGINQY